MIEPPRIAHLPNTPKEDIIPSYSQDEIPERQTCYGCLDLLLKVHIKR